MSGEASASSFDFGTELRIDRDDCDAAHLVSVNVSFLKKHSKSVSRIDKIKKQLK